MGYYIFCFVILVLLVFSHWYSREYLTVLRFFAFAALSIIPVFNLIAGCVAMIIIVCELFDEYKHLFNNKIILPGRRSKRRGY